MRQENASPEGNDKVRRGDVEQLVELGRIEERRGELNLALDRYAEATELLSDESDSAKRADIVRWMGTVRSDMGDTSEAETLYRQSLAMSESIGYEAGEAHAMNCLAIISQRKGEVDEAAALYRRGARLATLAGEHRLSGMIEQNLGVF